MKKLCLILTCLSFVTTGCTHGYRVSINGYSELVQPIEQNAPFYVSIKDSNSLNPIFDNQIKSKIQVLLERHNYTVVPDINDSKYIISFHIGSSSHLYYGYEPQYYVGFHHGYWSGYDFGYTTYVPYYDTYYDKWLTLKVSRFNDTGENKNKAVWVGEAAISSGSDDMRKIIDYLLAGCFRYFGADTSRKRNFVITEDDPEVLAIKFIR